MSLRSELVYYSRQCYKNRFLAATDGNLSVRTQKNTIITTASRTCKGNITRQDLVEVDFNFKIINGKGNPSTELKLHRFIYRERDDINAVVHTHPVFATAFAVSGNALDKNIFPELVINIGCVPLAPYGSPSTEELPGSISKFVKKSKAILLANHGLVAFGESLEEAYYITEKVDRAAEIIIYSRLLGGEKQLTKRQVDKLKILKKDK
jgi:L-fuculose-phosphate aldolase